MKIGQLLTYLSLCLPTTAFAQAPGPAPTEADNRNAFGPVQFGAAYASIVSFAVSPEISAATFDPDKSPGVIDPQIRVAKIPYRHLYGSEEDAARLYVQGDVAWQRYASGLDFGPGEFIDTEWQTIGGAVAAGLEVRGSEHLIWMPTLSVGYARLDNSTNYSGPVATGSLAPALDGFIFNWGASAIVYGASFGADYHRELSGLDMEINGSIAHNRIESVGSGDVDFSGSVTTFDIDLSTVHSTGWTLRDLPVSWVALLGHTRFFGSNRDALGFDSFYEVGLALDTDLTALRWRIKSIRFGLKRIFGAEVDGWGLVIGYGI